jgi:hypothetical protein
MPASIVGACLGCRLRAGVDDGSDRLQSDRFKVPVLNTDIDLPTGYLPAIMDVSMDEPTSVIMRALLEVTLLRVCFVAVRQVIQQNGLPRDFHPHRLFNRLKTSIQVMPQPTIRSIFLLPAFVMITGNQNLRTVQSLDQKWNQANVHCEIAEIIKRFSKKLRRQSWNKNYGPD